METTVNQRLAWIAEKHYGGSTKAMAVDCDIKPTTLVDILAGKSKPSYDTLVRVISSDLVGISARWLLLGEGPCYEEPIPLKQTDSTLVEVIKEQIQVISRQQALIETLTNKL